MSKKTYYIERFLAIVTAVILLQTLYYKFTGHEDSVYIFSVLGIEPQGRIGLGILELIAALLILYTRTAAFGAITAVCLMLGAILSHLIVLGIEIRGDGGKLFIMAVIAFASSLYVLFARGEQVYWVFKKLGGKGP